MTGLHWFPVDPRWRERLSKLRRSADLSLSDLWIEAVALANSPCDFVQTNSLDRVVTQLVDNSKESALPGKTIRLAVLASCTVSHLFGAIRIGGLRRNFWIEIYEAGYGQFRQELADPKSSLHHFRPDFVLFVLDAHHLAHGLSAMSGDEVAAGIEQQMAMIGDLWRTAQTSLGCSIIHQTLLPVHPAILGQNEHRLAYSSTQTIYEINHLLRRLADSCGADLLTIDTWSARDGLRSWYDAGLWHRAKQEILPTAAPVYGDLVARLIAARRGESKKCLVLDLDNTLWGGVIGDDGIHGIELGQGSALGEGYSALQAYVKDLARRGVILAVCSKNTESIAIEAFEIHPEMLLKRSDIACFIANWSDKPSNLRAIAGSLNIGLDSLVLLDDNPAERALVRVALPSVAVPEVTDDPISMVNALADGGYFESTAITEDDLTRTEQYQLGQARAALQASSTDISSYLAELKMTLLWRRFDSVGMKRIVQLINKTNQFNVRTRRYSEEEVAAVMAMDGSLGLQLRLIDRFGDNGIIAVCIGKLQGEATLFLDSWLMSCRVLGRQVEQATLNLIVDRAREMGAKRLVGEFIPTKKNQIVGDLFSKLGFEPMETSPEGHERACLAIDGFTPIETAITVRED
jgi:FkbH-like protein